MKLMILENFKDDITQFFSVLDISYPSSNKKIDNEFKMKRKFTKEFLNNAMGDLSDSLAFNLFHIS